MLQRPERSLSLFMGGITVNFLPLSLGLAASSSSFDLGATITASGSNSLPASSESLGCERTDSLRSTGTEEVNFMLMFTWERRIIVVIKWKPVVTESLKKGDGGDRLNHQQFGKLPLATERHFSFETGIETKNVTLLTLTFWFRNQKCHTLIKRHGDSNS